MPISIDTVYQRVLATANKEQRGYITPLEFNLLANQAQLAIFEQYFYDLDQFKRRKTEDTSFSDMTELIKNKLDPFTVTMGVIGGTTFPTSYRTGRIFYNNYIVEKVGYNEFNNFLNSTFDKEGLTRNPVYRESPQAGQDVEVLGFNTVTQAIGLVQMGVTVEAINKPGKVEWAYDVVAEKALYNANYAVDFSLHESEETTLVLKILELAGVILNKPGVVQIAAQEELQKIQQEKM